VSPKAELLDDGGAASSSPHFFRSAGFLAAEGVTHTLRIGELAAPLIVRDIPGTDRRDAISPYGYPGASGTAPVDPAEVDFSATGLVTIFIRDRALGEPAFVHPTERGPLLIADPSREPKSRMSDRQQIRRNLRDGLEVVSKPGPEVTGEERVSFERAYRDTMVRAEASERYMFSGEYFAALLGEEGTWLFSVNAPGGEYAAGSIAALSDDCLHYYLSGTAEDHLRASPMKNIVAAMSEFAADRGVPLNLGGGVVPGDRLEEFKRGFANAETRFRTHEIVSDAEAYEELSAGVDAETDYFPRYRA
jgi:hypothetical protein